MDLIQKQDAAVCLLHQAVLGGVGAAERAAHIAKQLAVQQLRVVGVIGAVEGDKGGIRRQQALLHRIVVHILCQKRFAGTRRTNNECVQAVGWIRYRRLRLMDLRFQAAVVADHPGKHVGALGFLLRGDFYGRFRLRLGFFFWQIAVQFLYQIARHIVAHRVQPQGQRPIRKSRLLLQKFLHLYHQRRAQPHPGVRNAVDPPQLHYLFAAQLQHLGQLFIGIGAFGVFLSDQFSQSGHCCPSLFYVSRYISRRKFVWGSLPSFCGSFLRRCKAAVPPSGRSEYR